MDDDDEKLPGPYGPALAFRNAWSNQLPGFLNSWNNFRKNSKTATRLDGTGSLWAISNKTGSVKSLTTRLYASSHVASTASGPPPLVYVRAMDADVCAATSNNGCSNAANSSCAVRKLNSVRRPGWTFTTSKLETTRPSKSSNAN